MGQLHILLWSLNYLKGDCPMKLEFDDQDSLLIWLYLEISALFSQTELPLYTTRFSPNHVPFFTDAELFTCVPKCRDELVKSQDKKTGYEYIKKHYDQWFPALPCYEVYNRIPTSRDCERLLCSKKEILCRRKITNCGSTSSPNIAQARTHKLPLPIEFALASASIHDLKIAKETLPDSELENMDLFGNNAYIDKSFLSTSRDFETKNIKLITGIKKRKVQTNLILFQQATNSIY